MSLMIFAAHPRNYFSVDACLGPTVGRRREPCVNTFPTCVSVDQRCSCVLSKFLQQYIWLSVFSLDATMTTKWNDLHSLIDALKTPTTTIHASVNTVKKAQTAVDTIITRGAVESDATTVTPQGVKAVYACVIQAFSVPTLKLKTPICGPLISFIRWFLPVISEEQRNSVWNVLFLQKEFKPTDLTIEKLKNNAKIKPQKEEKHPSLNLLLDLLTAKELRGKHVDDVVDLLHFAMETIQYVQIKSSSRTESKLSPFEEALNAIVASKPLLSLYLNPLIVKSTSKGHDSSSAHEQIEVNDFTEVEWSDGKFDASSTGTIGPRSRPDVFSLDGIRSKGTSKESFTELLQNLSVVYKPDCLFSKSQLFKILETVLSCQNSTVFDVFFSHKLSVYRNDSLLASVLEFLFVSSHCLAGGDWHKITSFVTTCAENKNLAGSGIHGSCSRFLSVEFSNRNRSWLIQRLNLFSLFFSEDAKSVAASDLPSEIFNRLFDLFVFLTTESDVLNDASIESDEKDASSDFSASFKTILTSFQGEAFSFSLFSLLLSALSSNPEHMTSLLSLCTADMIENWPSHVTHDDLDLFLNLFQVSETNDTMTLASALNSILASPEGRSTLIGADISESDLWRLFEKLISSMDETEFENTFLECFVFLLGVLEAKTDLVYRALESGTRHVLAANLPDDVSDALFSLLFRKNHEERSRQYFCFVFEELLQIESLEDVCFFSSLVAFLDNLPQSEKHRACTTLSDVSELVLLLLSRREEGECVSSLVQLLKLIFETSQETKTVSRSQRDHIEQVPFFSARLPQHQSIHWGSASVDDLSNLSELLKKPRLNLNSGHLRNAIFGNIDASVPNEGAYYGSNETRLIHTTTTEENIRKIEEMVSDGHPILLYGSSGVGKVS